MKVVQRFLEYVKIDTASNRENQQNPSSLCQFDLAHQLAFELKQLGMKNVVVDNHCFVYGKLPATKGMQHVVKLGLISHLDTYPDILGKNVKPCIVENFDGNVLEIGKSGLKINATEEPHLLQLKGQTVITACGDTILGADDKAGIAEIITAIENVIARKKPHGQISVSFIPDEEIGRGTDFFDFKTFDAEYAYTVDGFGIGEIAIETFNARQAIVKFTGVNVHTGYAKDRMVNAQLLALEFANALPPKEIPAKASEREGFYHLLKSHGNIEKAELIYNMRDFELANLERRQTWMCKQVEKLNKKYGKGSASIEFSEQYRNMKNELDKYPELQEKAIIACSKAGIKPYVKTIRGGTDGARLTFKGLPCPNLGAGGWNYHSLYEHITIEALEQISKMLEELIFQFNDITKK